MKNQYSTCRTSCAAAFLILTAFFLPAAVKAADLPNGRSIWTQDAGATDVEDLALSRFAPSATFESARVVHRVKFNEKWWMQIHIKFRIKNGQSNPCKMYAYFYDDEDGKPLEAGDGFAKYTTAKGNVYTALDFTPSLNDAEYNDLTLSIPYDALNLETEKGSEYNLKYFLVITDELTKKEVAKSVWYKFSLKY